MARIAISPAAFEAIKATLPLGVIGTLCAGTSPAPRARRQSGELFDLLANDCDAVTDSHRSPFGHCARTHCRIVSRAEA
jgi:hypothetical protein